ncbi:MULTISPECIES: hypothetical protein [unclassified Sulfitobacter]|uniref:hypothetical protein n=1 Tax=unclassified Sulfitobacter TaxID=196795 RepID=UPI0037472A49
MIHQLSLIWSEISQGFLGILSLLPQLDKKIELGFDIATMLTIIGAAGVALREQTKSASTTNRLKVRRDATRTAAGILVSFLEEVPRIQSRENMRHMDKIISAARTAQKGNSTAPLRKKEIFAELDKAIQGADNILTTTLRTRYTLKPVMAALGNDAFTDDFWRSSLKMHELNNRLRRGRSLFEDITEFEKKCDEFSARASRPEREEVIIEVEKVCGQTLGSDIHFVRESIFKQIALLNASLRPDRKEEELVETYTKGANDFLNDVFDSESAITLKNDLGNFYYNALINGGVIQTHGVSTTPLTFLVYMQFINCLEEINSEVQYMLRDTSFALNVVLQFKEYSGKGARKELELYHRDLRVGKVLR